MKPKLGEKTPREVSYRSKTRLETETFAQIEMFVFRDFFPAHYLCPNKSKWSSAQPRFLKSGSSSGINREQGARSPYVIPPLGQAQITLAS